MRLALVALAFLAAQDPSPVGPLVAKVDEKDSRASFRAIEGLVALPPARRKEVEEAAAQLPEFYREALLSELGLQATLGEHFGREVRVTLKGDPRTAVTYLAELSKQSGIKIEPGYMLRERAGDPFALELENVPLLSALAEICVKAKQYPMVSNPSMITLNPTGADVRTFAYRNFAVFLNQVSLIKRVNFGGPAPWTCQLWCVPIADPGVKVISWKSQTRLIEAVTDKGERLEAAAAETASAIQHTDEDPPPAQGTRGSNCGVLLRVPGALPEKLSRLRFVATAVVARDSRDYAITKIAPPEPARAGDDLFEVEVTDTEGSQHYQQELTVVVRPRKKTPAELLALPLAFEVKYKDAEDGQTWSQGKIVDRAVEYRVRWWPLNYRRWGNNRAVESVKVSIPVDVVDRPVYVEFRDIGLK